MSEATIDRGTNRGSEHLVDTDQVKQLGGTIKDKVFHAADERIEGFVKEIEQIGSKLGEHDGQEAAPVAEFVSSFARNASESLRDLRAEDLLRKGREQLRERPGIVLAGLLGIGFLGARMLRR